MRELTYTLLELERGSRKICDFCPFKENNRSVNQIVTRIKASDKYIADSVVCEECKEKFENDELLKCERCGRLQTRHDIDVISGEYICDCVRYNEDLEEKEISPSPPREGTFAFYERQINALREEKTTAENTIEEERAAHEDFMRVSEEWGKRQKQELLDRIKELEAENKQLKSQNQKIVPENLLNQIKSYEKEIAELKEQVEQLSKQQITQIEVPVKRLKTS